MGLWDMDTVEETSCICLQNVFKRNLLLHLHNKRKSIMNMEVAGF